MQRASPSTPSRPGASESEDLQARVLLGMFAQRTVSIVAFMLTVIVFPFIAIPVVGVAGFGALMGMGPLAAIATGPLSGLLARRLSARDAMAVNAGVRVLLSLLIPALSITGAMNFWTLLAASIANGWLLSSIMTTENIYIRRFSGRHLGSINALTMINFLAVQALLGLILGVGRLVGGWDPMLPYYLSAAAHAFIILPIIWMTIPAVAAASTSPGGASPVGAARGIVMFLRRSAREALVLVAGLMAFPLLHTTIPAGLALVYWISRTAGFRELWARRDLRHAVLLIALAVALFLPLQTFGLPILAEELAGGTGKALLLGQLLGALYFGQLVSSASQARLPALRIPLIGRVGAHRIVQAGVLGLGAVWVYLDLFPGSVAAAAATVVVMAALMRLSGALTHLGWIQCFGLGLLATLLPLLAWGNVPLLFISMLLRGLLCGPGLVSLTTYFFSRVPGAGAESMIGIQGSLFNAAMSLGYGALSLLAGLGGPVFPGLLWPLGAAFVAAAVLFALAPRLLPGLPEARLRRNLGPDRAAFVHTPNPGSDEDHG